MRRSAPWIVAIGRPSARRPAGFASLQRMPAQNEQLDAPVRSQLLASSSCALAHEVAAVHSPRLSVILRRRSGSLLPSGSHFVRISRGVRTWRIKDCGTARPTRGVGSGSARIVWQLAVWQFGSHPRRVHGLVAWFESRHARATSDGSRMCVRGAMQSINLPWGPRRFRLGLSA
jgi:hypothetical protein